MTGPLEGAAGCVDGVVTDACAPLVADLCPASVTTAYLTSGGGVEVPTRCRPDLADRFYCRVVCPRLRAGWDPGTTLPPADWWAFPVEDGRLCYDPHGVGCPTRAAPCRVAAARGYWPAATLDLTVGILAHEAEDFRRSLVSYELHGLFA